MNWVVAESSESGKVRGNPRVGRGFRVDPDAAAEAASVWAEMPILYKLPDGAVTVAPLPLAGTTWHRGTTTVTLRNPYDDPLEVAVVLAAGPADGVAESGKPVRLAPGGSHSAPVHLCAPARIGHDEVKFTLRVEFVLLAEDGGRIELRNQLAMPKVGG